MSATKTRARFGPAAVTEPQKIGNGTALELAGRTYTVRDYRQGQFSAAWMLDPNAGSYPDHRFSLFGPRGGLLGHYSQHKGQLIGQLWDGRSMVGSWVRYSPVLMVWDGWALDLTGRSRAAIVAAVAQHSDAIAAGMTAKEAMESACFAAAVASFA